VLMDQMKSTELDVARRELTELHSKLDECESAKELLKQQLQETQVCIIHMKYKNQLISEDECMLELDDISALFALYLAVCFNC